MNDLIESLQIFSKYFDATEKWPTHCEHDELWLCVADQKDTISEDDQERLNKLGWHWHTGNRCWLSFRFGSC